MRYIPAQERRYASQMFHALFQPILESNGFVRDGSFWWRIHAGMYLQGIAFNTYPHQKYVTDLVVEYSILPLYSNILSNFRCSFIENHHKLSGYLPSGYPEINGHFEVCTADDDGLPGDVRRFPVRNSVSFYKVYQDVDEALIHEHQVFRERTLPRLNAISTPPAYLEYYNGLDHAPLSHICHENYIATNLFLRNWDEARRGIIAASHMDESAIKHTTDLLRFNGNEKYIASLMGADSFSTEQLSTLVRSILTLQQTELPLTTSETANKRITEVNRYLQQRIHHRMSLQAVLAQDESWAERRLTLNYTQSRTILQSMLPQMPFPDCSIADVFATYGNCAKRPVNR